MVKGTGDRCEVNPQSWTQLKGSHGTQFKESRGQELSYTHYTPIYTIYSLRNCYLNVA